MEIDSYITVKEETLLDMYDMEINIKTIIQMNSVLIEKEIIKNEEQVIDISDVNLQSSNYSHTENHIKLICNDEVKIQDILIMSTKNSKTENQFKNNEEIVKKEEDEIEISDIKLQLSDNGQTNLKFKNEANNDQIEMCTNFKTENQSKELCCDNFNVDKEFSENYIIDEKFIEYNNDKIIFDSDSNTEKTRLCKSTELPNVLNCKYCNGIFKDKHEMNYHIALQHKVYVNIQMCSFENNLQPSKRKKKIIDVDNLQESDGLNGSYKSKEDKSPNNRLKQHKMKLSNNKVFRSSKIYTCKVCSFETKYRSCLDRHLNKIHNEQITKNQCEFCNKLFKLKSTLDEHLLRLHKQEIENDIEDFITSKMHICKSCSYVTTKNIRLKEHINLVHNGEKTKINCQFCKKSFSRRPTLNEHLLKHHKKAIKNDIKHFITSKIKICKICSYETISNTQFKAHFNSMHNEHKTKITCQFCLKSYNKKRSLDYHLLKQHKQEIKSDMKDFITSKTFSCKICSYETIYMSLLNSHTNAFHNKHRTKINCRFCDKSFITKQSIDNHMIKQHKKEIKSNEKVLITSKIHKCNICTYQTTKKNSLNTHMNIHSENKTKEICQFCDRSFSRKQILNDHLLKQHKKEIKSDIKKIITSKIHTCKFCSYKTTYNTALDIHIRSHHSVNPLLTIRTKTEREVRQLRRRPKLEQRTK